jgi:hypothetical protein
MNLPSYHNYNLRTASFEELNSLLTPEINLKHPVVINMKGLDQDQQRELIGLIENYFVTHNISFKFPYPVYIMTEHEGSISNLPLVRNPQELPRFFIPREGKMNVKETHLAGKNKLLQQEIRNADSELSEESLKAYARSHREIFELEEEILFYRSLMNKLIKAKING